MPEARRTQRCTRCNVWIYTGQACEMAPFRCVGCPQWLPGELEKLAAIGVQFQGVPAAQPGGVAAPDPVYAPGCTPSKFVTVMDRKELGKQLKNAEDELTRAEQKCRGIIKFNPGHLAETHYQCVSRWEDLAGTIAYYKQQLEVTP